MFNSLQMSSQFERSKKCSLIFLQYEDIRDSGCRSGHCCDRNDALKRFGDDARAALGRARNATQNFLGGVRKRLQGVAQRISTSRLSRIGDELRTAGGRAARVLGLDHVVSFIRKRLGGHVDDLDDKDLKHIVQAVHDTMDDAASGNSTVPDGGDDAGKTDDDALVDDANKKDDDVPADDTGKTDDGAPADDASKTDDDVPADDASKTDDDAPADDASKTDDDAPADDASKTDDDAPADDASKTDDGAPADDPSK
ncbi:hypothetical protein RRG08_027366 [Elysia crispata]|uniref:Uncharacterized protein n=1 Tax=Elysia crispata TaxID=231223 RepID=A0AAE0YLT4_9GAST|nr:hypothetical protein RRG08_027366 [Elysia crispata]